MEKTTEPQHGRIPFWLKVGCTVYLVLLVPTYWRWYGPANFLWFCDAALLLTCLALWLQSPLLASIQAVAAVLPLAIWTIDFLAASLRIHFLGISQYMFDSGMPLYLRALSTFHIWLPLLLLWMLYRLGYERRAWIYQSAIAIVLMAASYAWTDPAHPPNYPGASVNVNRVYGTRPTQAQQWMNPHLYLLIQMMFWPVCFYLPTHLVLRRLFLDPTMTAARNLWQSNHPPDLHATPDAHARA